MPQSIMHPTTRITMKEILSNPDYLRTIDEFPDLPGRTRKGLNQVGAYFLAEVAELRLYTFCGQLSAKRNGEYIDNFQRISIERLQATLSIFNIKLNMDIVDRPANLQEFRRTLENASRKFAENYIPSDGGVELAGKLKQLLGRDVVAVGGQFNKSSREITLKLRPKEVKILLAALNKSQATLG